MLSKLRFSVFDLAKNEAETACREACIKRFSAAQEGIEAEVCSRVEAPPNSAISDGSASSKDRTDGMTRESCEKGVDSGLFLGCKSWCDTRQASSTHATFRHDALYALANATKGGKKLLQATCTSVQGRAVRIQLLRDKEARQPVETESCEFGLRAAFASVVITEQRLSGVDKLQLPIAYWEHSPMDNPRRRRFFYWWGGTDPRVRAGEECGQVYRDPGAESWRETCARRMQGEWEAEARGYYFALTDPSSGLGGGAMPQASLPLLAQSVESVSADGQVSKHVAVRNAEQSAAEAARAFCASHLGLRDKEGEVPYLGECEGALSTSLRIESEVADDEDLAKMRLY